MPMPHSLDFSKFIARFDTNEMQVLQLCPFVFWFLFWRPRSLHFYVHFSVSFSICCYCSVTKLSDSLWLHGPQHTRLLCPSLSPRVCSDSCPLCWWCYLTILSSATPFSFCLQSFSASGSFAMSQLFLSGGQSTEISICCNYVSFWWII